MKIRTITKKWRKLIYYHGEFGKIEKGGVLEKVVEEIEQNTKRRCDDSIKRTHYTNRKRRIHKRSSRK